VCVCVLLYTYSQTLSSVCPFHLSWYKKELSSPFISPPLLLYITFSIYVMNSDLPSPLLFFSVASSTYYTCVGVEVRAREEDKPSAGASHLLWSPSSCHSAPYNSIFRLNIFPPKKGQKATAALWVNDDNDVMGMLLSSSSHEYNTKYLHNI